MQKEYKITQEQLENLEYFKNMFSLNAEEIKLLYSKDEFNIAFELGILYNCLRTHHITMMELLIAIGKQRIV